MAYSLLPKAKNMKPFIFTRIQYNSGDWDTDQRMPSNILNSLVEYTTIPIDEKEKVVLLSSNELFKSPFCYLSGHKLVEFSSQERDHFHRYISNGGFVFVDDCNHDIDGLFAKSFEQEMARTFGAKALQKIPNTHEIYNCFFKFEGPPTTTFELNGWGDDLVQITSKRLSLMAELEFYTAIKITAASGTTISETNVGLPKTIQNLE